MVARALAAGVLGIGVVVLALAVLDDGPSSPATSSRQVSTDAADRAAPTVASTTPAAGLSAPPENLGPRPDLVGIDGWLNTDIDSLADLDGQVVMVEMWTFGCSNCKARIPHTQELYAAHADDGFEIVGVHAPEFATEAELANIEEAIERLGVTWPVALDTERRSFRAWQEGGRRFWPRTFVIDQRGDIRFDHIGEGAYDELAHTVAWLLENPPTG